MLKYLVTLTWCKPQWLLSNYIFHILVKKKAQDTDL